MGSTDPIPSFKTELPRFSIFYIIPQISIYINSESSASKLIKDAKEINGIFKERNKNHNTANRVTNLILAFDGQSATQQS